MRLLNPNQTRAAVLAGLTLAGLTLFQNCGGSHFDASLLDTPARSPFFEKRVRIEDALLSTQGKSQSLEPQRITVLVNNPCAIEACKQDSNAIVCDLQKSGIKEGFEKLLQAYTFVPEVPVTTAELEEEIRFNHADQKCLIGMSTERSYQNAAAVPNDPGAAGQYHHQVLGSWDALEWLKALSKPTDPVIVGMVDSGVQNTHEDFAGVSIVNSNFSASCTTICHFHGNAVAGIIAAVTGNSKGIAGLFSGNIMIYSAQVGNDTGAITTTELVNGLTWLRNVKSEVINLSLGGFNTNDFSLQDAFERLAAADINVVVSSGNNSYDLDKAAYYPASFNVSGQINVGSASPRDIPMASSANATAAQIASPIELDEYSNYSPGTVHLAAPGKAIHTLGLNSGYTVASGTSFAAPMVTAAVIWVRHYAKANQLKMTARQVKELVLQGTVPVDALEGKIQARRYLNFSALKQELQNMNQTAGSTPGVISLVSSEVIGTAPSQRVKVTVAISNANASTGWTMRVYTNPDFLADTFTGQTCRVTTNMTCTFEVSYTQMLVDPGIYFEIKDDTGKLVSDRLITKTQLNTGNRATAAILGEVINATVRGNKVSVEGWACLKTFPDQLNIEVRMDSATGTVIDTIEASRWARGDYFAACESSEVRLGFEYTLPVAQANGTARKIFFRAVTLDGTRGLNLPVYSYQPGYNDVTPAQTVDSVYIDPYVREEAPEVKFTQVEYKNFILKLEGTACFKNTRRPVALALGLGVEDMLDLIPEMRLPYTKALVSNVTGGLASDPVYDVGGMSASVTYTNSASRAIDNAGSMVRYSPPFNDDTDEYGFYPTNMAKSNRLLRAGSDTFSQFGLLTVSPSVDKSDGCAFNSGFTLTYDVRSVIEGVDAQIGVSWRKDKIPDIKALLATRGIPASFIALLDAGGTVNRNITSMAWSPRALPVSYAIIGATNRVYDVAATVDSFMTFMKTASIVDGWNNPSQAAASARDHLVMSGDITGTGGATAMYYDGWTVFPDGRAEYSGSSVMGKTFPLHSWIWADKSQVSLNLNATTQYSMVKSVPAITLKAQATDRLLVGLTYSGAIEVPVPRDLLLEFQLNGAGNWYQAYLTKVGTIRTTSGQTTYEGELVADVTLPATATTIALRLRAKGTQKFNLNRVGVWAE